MAAERRPEHRAEDLEEGFRRHQDRDDVDPRRQGPEVQGRGRKPRERNDPAEDENDEEDDERDSDAEEGSRFPPGSDVHRWSGGGTRSLMTVTGLSRVKGAWE